VSKPGSCRGSVFVDEAAEHIVAFDLCVGRSSSRVSRFGWGECEGAVWPLGVVVGHVAAEHVFEVAAAEDQQPVEKLGADRVHEPLCVGVCLWRLNRRLDDLDSFAVEDLVEGGYELAVRLSRSS
jgi:hypothetical protein